MYPLAVAYLGLTAPPTRSNARARQNLVTFFPPRRIGRYDAKDRKLLVLFIDVLNRWRFAGFESVR